jgi:Secretion system C-terminal sorting domain
MIIGIHGKIKIFFILLLSSLLCSSLKTNSQNITHYLRNNFFGAPDLVRDIRSSFDGANPGYYVYVARNVTGNGEQIRIGPRRLSNGNLSAVWVSGTNLQTGVPQSFVYFPSVSLPSFTLSRFNQFPEEGYSYVFKIEANGNQNARGILMEFDREPAFQLEYFDDNNLFNIGVNTPFSGIVQLTTPIAGGQYFYVRYRHSTDPVNQYQWTAVNFPITNGRFGYFSIPAFFFTGSVEMKLFCKSRPISSFPDNSYTDNIYDVPFISQSTRTVQIVSTVPSPINSEFTVNMTGQTVSPEGVFLKIQNPNVGRLLKMTNTGNNIYKVIVKATPTEVQNYIFQNGIVTENVPVACRGQNTTFRSFIPTVAQPNPIPVCFNACNTSCAGNAATVNVTFRVNATGETVSPSGIKLVGSFNNFSTTATPMTLIGNNVYEATVPITIGEVVTYKFLNGNTFEAVPPGCAINDGNGNLNRFFSVPAANTTLNTVCFNRCDNSCASTPPNVNITFRVNMTGQTINAGGVKLAGTFNGFSITTNPMTLIGNNVYETTVSLNAGSSFQYKFVNGNVFELIPSECGVDDGGGNINRIIQTGTNNNTLNTVCFSSCDNSCASTPPVNVTFKVNMTGQTISSSGVFLAGSFNSFSTTATAMTLIGNNIFQATVPLTPGAIVQYKFVNGTNFELINAGCGVNDGNDNINRFINVPTLPLTLNTVCFNSCTNACVAGNSTTGVTFRVNMTGQNISSAGVKLAGSFNGFSTTANPMMAMGANVYEATIDLPINSTFSYKFVNGSNFELVSAQCGVNDGGGNINRTVSTTNLASQLAPAVCFGSCSDCNRSQITFRVNMGTEPISSSGVFLAGSFNSFSTTANQMTAVGNNIFETTVPLTPGTQATYKFVNGSNFELITSECGIMGGATVYDRLLNVPATNSVLGLVCFNSCNNCTTTSVTNASRNEIRFYPNPVTSVLYLNTIINGSFAVYDVSGRIIKSNNSASGVFQKIDLSLLPPGIYFIRIAEKNKTASTLSFIKQ